MNPWVERLGWTLLHFVWQGVLIAGLYAVGRRALKACSPNARYLVACAALAAMVAAPALTLAVVSDLPVRVASGASLVGDAGHFSGAAAASGSQVISIASDETRQTAMGWVVLFWLTGASIFCIRLMGGWWMTLRVRSRRVREAPAEWREAFAGIGARIGVLRPVRLLVSALVRVPTVVGWLRPVVLVPVGALAGLPPEHVEALLAHEFAHIRRHDYLVNILQSVAEALLFYHPAVWWVSGHMRSERELCCDDIAVSASGDACGYASALAELESLRPDRFGVAMAANGGLLADRVARLLGVSPTAARMRPGPGVIVIAMLLVVIAFGVFAQAAARSNFEAASIKRAKAGTADVAIRRFSHGRITGENTPLRYLIEVGYQPTADRILGGPRWIDTDGYDITAKAEGDASADQMRPMLQTLLEERFKLKLHRETRDLPVYDLVIAKNGLKLSNRKEGACVTVAPYMELVDSEPGRPSLLPCGRVGVMMYPARGRLKGGGTSMERVTKLLTGLLHRTVIDQTGFTGTFDVDLEFARDDSPAGTPTGDTALPSIFVALQERLGLRLEAGKGAVEVLVIDHVERPSEN